MYIKSISQEYNVNLRALCKACISNAIELFVPIVENGLNTQSLTQDNLKSILKHNGKLKVDKNVFTSLTHQWISSSQQEDFFLTRTIDDICIDGAKYQEVVQIALNLESLKNNSHWKKKRQTVISVAQNFINENKDNSEIFKTIKGKKTLNASYMAEFINDTKASYEQLVNISRGLSRDNIHRIVCKAINDGKIKI